MTSGREPFFPESSSRGHMIFLGHRHHLAVVGASVGSQRLSFVCTRQVTESGISEGRHAFFSPLSILLSFQRLFLGGDDVQDELIIALRTCPSSGLSYALTPVNCCPSIISLSLSICLHFFPSFLLFLNFSSLFISPFFSLKVLSFSQYLLLTPSTVPFPPPFSLFSLMKFPALYLSQLYIIALYLPFSLSSVRTDVVILSPPTNAHVFLSLTIVSSAAERPVCQRRGTCQPPSENL